MRIINKNNNKKKIIKEKFLSIYRNFKKFSKLFIEFCDIFAKNLKKLKNKTLFSIKSILKNISLLNKQGFNYQEE